MTQTLTTERLREIASSPSFSANPLSHEVKYMARELLANREAQPVGFYTTLSGRKGVVWHNGAPEDDTAIYTAPPAPAVPEAISTRQAIANMERHELCGSINVAYKHGWNDFRAAMLAQPVSQGCKLPEGFKLMPIEITDEIAEAIALEARCCGGIALCIYEAALAAAPEGGNG